MGLDDVPLDDKAKRTRDLLSSFYALGPSMSSSRATSFEAINTNSFDADQYMNLLIQRSNLEGLLQRHVEMAAEIKNLDTDLQMLVYENYNKFISATDTIKRMKSNIVGMETNMEQLLEKAHAAFFQIMSVQSRSDGVNTSLFEKREHIEKLHRTRNLLRKVQFIYDLPARLEKCIKSEAYVDAVRYYTGAMPIFKAYGDSSFKDCKRASEEAVAVIIKNLQGKLFSDSESIQARAEAAVVLKQLDFPVESLQAKLLEKLEQSVLDLHFKMEDLKNASIDYGDPSREGNMSESPPANVHEVSVREFVEAIRAYRVIFSDSDEQLIKLARGLIAKHFETTDEYQKNRLSSADLLCVLRIIWKDVLLMDKVFPEGALPDYCLEAAQVSLKQHLSSTFSQLLHDISDALTQTHIKQEGKQDNSLQMGLEASKKTVLQGSVDILLDLHQLLLEDSSELLVKLRDFIIDWIQEGFQNFFQAVDNHFHSLARRNSSASHDQNLTEGTQCDRVSAGLVLVLAQLSLYIEQTAISRITEEIAASFSGGSARGFEYGPAFVPGEVCRIFHSSGEKFLHLYISMRTQRMSVLLKKRFTTPNWVKHKEPREVHMFVDLFLHELEAIGNEVKQILPQGLLKHRRTESNGSTTSSRSAPLREEKLGRSNTQRARSQLLETHLAKLFKQKVEIVTKVEFTQESVATNVVKLCLKSLQEFVRLQTFNRSGFQQIQLDIQFLRTPIKEIVVDEAAMDFLLDEVIVAASERCLDPVPLEPPILDKLVQAKLAKTKEHNSTSS